MFLPAKWQGIGRLIFTLREHYEPELAYLEKVLSAGKTFVDVGASFGIYTVAASRMVGDTGRVLAFEPSVQSFPILQKNIDDIEAHGGGDVADPLYSVRFTSRELWGEAGTDGDVIHVDLFERYLQEA